MSFVISALAHTIWTWLPEITVALRFTTALIGFCLTADLMIQRMRRRMRPPR